jgi:hypothetical protein
VPVTLLVLLDWHWIEHSTKAPRGSARALRSNQPDFRAPPFALDCRDIFVWRRYRAPLIRSRRPAFTARPGAPGNRRLPGGVHFSAERCTTIWARWSEFFRDRDVRGEARSI